MKIVALGDSLTVGEDEFELSDSDEVASYPKYLETLAEKRLSNLQSDLEVNVLNRGICGDLTSGMLERFSKDVVDEKADYVIILGGTNDVGWGFDILPFIFEENGKLFHFFSNSSCCFFKCAEVATIGIINSPRRQQFFT